MRFEIPYCYVDLFYIRFIYLDNEYCAIFILARHSQIRNGEKFRNQQSWNSSLKVV